MVRSLITLYRPILYSIGPYCIILPVLFCIDLCIQMVPIKVFALPDNSYSRYVHLNIPFLVIWYEALKYFSGQCVMYIWTAYAVLFEVCSCFEVMVVWSSCNSLSRAIFITLLQNVVLVYTPFLCPRTLVPILPLSASPSLCVNCNHIPYFFYDIEEIECSMHFHLSS